MKKISNQLMDYLEYCEKVRQMSPVTIKTKRYILNRFIKVTGIKDLKKLDNEAFNRWIEDEKKEGVSVNSINAYNAVVIAMVRYYIESGLTIPIKINLIRGLKEEKTKRNFYTLEEIEEVILGSDLVTNLMIKIMFETGMRITELTKLKVSDFEGRRISFIGKGRKEREVYISTETLGLLREFVKKYEVKNYLWGFGALNGEPPTVNTVRDKLKEAFRSVGFEGFYPHALRHSFATNLQLRGASIEEIKEMMGHESIATTERYLHGFDGKLEELFKKYQ